MSKKVLKFPKDFLWGAAVSSYQVEGGIENCNWSERFPAGNACDYYNQYEKYFDLAKELNHNVHRLSLEWSRIQPSEGKFDRKEIEHYRKILLALRKRKIKSMVTIWHYTLPLWLSERGGLHNKKFPEYFENFTKFVVEELDDLVDFWVTVNEPMVYLSLGYIEGRFPPQKKKSLLALIVFVNFVRVHKKAYNMIHSINPNAKVGTAQNYCYSDAHNPKSFINKSLVKISDFLTNHIFSKLINKHSDFIGINYYFHNRIRITPFSFPFIKIDNENKKVSDMNWEIFPRGLYFILKDMKKYNKPIYITENGVADASDKKRPEFIREHLKWMHKAIGDGVDVKGYMYWSLLDNFEWDSGFAKRFGLIEIDCENGFEAKIRQSAYDYAEICKENSLSL
ncbi:MAG: glycoside hydrolase family 1 protein [Candidatus Pacebacteria bacterium]|nr:glycoside hydrolase family 1 protein [Candidatus Paceibacterota bacterium]